MREFIILNSEGEHEYDLKVQERKDTFIYKLYRSDSEPWTEWCRGEFIVGIEDDGNGIKFFGDLTKDRHLDYAQSSELSLIVRAYNQIDKSSYDKFSMIEKTNEIKL